MTRSQRWALLLGTLLSLNTVTTYGQLSDAERALVQGLFPKATRIEPKQADFPVYPVYQLQQLLGYAYESADLSDLPGFSGKPIRLLIGLDTAGRFTGVRVLDHHEPVFLHGLGPEPLFRFIDQYRGRSLTEHIVVDSRRSGNGAPAGGPVYIDGVTKATVSVIIINDTVLTSALQVARNRLEGFSLAPPARARSDLFRPLNWDQLLEAGYLGHWQLPVAEVEAALGQGLDSYPGFTPPVPGAPFIDLYYGYLNAPIVGRNLLGERAYDALMASLPPDDHLFAVISRGAFLHVPDDFKPGTVPGRLALEQQQLSIELRDLNALEGPAPFPIAGIPAFDRAHLFRVRGHAGFNPAAEAAIRLNVALDRNHLIRDQAGFSAPFTLPGELFEAVAAAPAHDRKPIWIGLWGDRLPQVAVLAAALGVLTLFFLRQRHYARNARALHRFRWGYLWFTLLFIGVYAQGQLSVVNIYTLLLSLWDGFDIRVFLLDPVIFILWSFTFVSLLLWGRGLYCGWLCPFGALQEILSALARRLGLRQWRIPEPWHRRLILAKYPLLLGLVASAFYSLTLAERLAEVEPFKTSLTLFFLRSWPFVLYALVLLGLGLFVHKFYCRYLCALGAGLAVVGRLRRFSWLRRIELCGTPCQLCKHRCEINAIRRDGGIDYDECIQCLECIVILEDPHQCVASLQQRKRAARARGAEVVPGLIARDGGPASA